MLDYGDTTVNTQLYPDHCPREPRPPPYRTANHVNGLAPLAPHGARPLNAA